VPWHFIVVGAGFDRRHYFIGDGTVNILAGKNCAHPSWANGQETASKLIGVTNLRPKSTS
jgi:hypothetical protein